MSMVLIQRQVLSSSAASVTFSNIPQNFKTLRLVVSARSDANAVGDDMYFTFNGSGSTYSARRLYGNGSTAASDTGVSAGWINSATATSNTFGSLELTIPNYTSSTQKPISSDAVTENNATSALQFLVAGLWNGTSAITSVAFTLNAGRVFVANSSFSLYGLI